MSQNRLEAKFTTKLKKWMEHNLNNIPAYGWEVKYPRSKTYSFKADKSFPSELGCLLLWQRRKFIYKFSDIARLGTPHDGITATGWSCFIFTWDGNIFYMIDAITIEGLVDDGIKGINEDMAKSLCLYKASLKTSL